MHVLLLRHLEPIREKLLSIRHCPSISVVHLLVLEGLPQRQGAAVAQREDKDTGSRSSRKYSLAGAPPESVQNNVLVVSTLTT